MPLKRYHSSQEEALHRGPSIFGTIFFEKGKLEQKVATSAVAVVEKSKIYAGTGIRHARRNLA
jgi:hypothetical protein